MIITKEGHVLVDFRGIPTCACPVCGSHLLEITAAFCPETYEIEMYLLDNARCAMCQTHLTVEDSGIRQGGSHFLSQQQNLHVEKVKKSFNDEVYFETG